jgi:hypothetical protein
MSDDKPKAVGFLERRWRMIKAGAKKIYEKLFDVKTYIYAGVMFGGAALLGQVYPQNELVQGIAKIFGVAGDGAGVGVLMGMTRVIALGALINAGMGMVQESNACNDCKTHQPTPSTTPLVQKAAETAAHVASHHDFGETLTGNLTPLSTPTITNVAGKIVQSTIKQ